MAVDHKEFAKKRKTFVAKTTEKQRILTNVRKMKKPPNCLQWRL